MGVFSDSPPLASDPLHLNSHVLSSPDSSLAIRSGSTEHSRYWDSSSIKPFYEIYILYNAYDDDFVSKILRPKLAGILVDERYVIQPCRILPTDTLHAWDDIPLRDRHDLQKVIVVLSDRYLHVIGRSSEYKRQRVKEIHRCHETLIIQLGEITSDVLDKVFGQTSPKINWFAWPKEEDERLSFWRSFAFHINP